LAVRACLVVGAGLVFGAVLAFGAGLALRTGLVFASARFRTAFFEGRVGLALIFFATVHLYQSWTAPAGFRFTKQPLSPHIRVAQRQSSPRIRGPHAVTTLAPSHNLHGHQTAGHQESSADKHAPVTSYLPVTSHPPTPVIRRRQTVPFSRKS